jgi:hypothetical protein
MCWYAGIPGIARDFVSLSPGCSSDGEKSFVITLRAT